MRLLYFSTVGFFYFLFFFLSVAFPARPYMRLPQPVPKSKGRRGGCYLKYDPFENFSHVGVSPQNVPQIEQKNDRQAGKTARIQILSNFSEN